MAVNVSASPAAAPRVHRGGARCAAPSSEIAAAQPHAGADRERDDAGHGAQPAAPERAARARRETRDRRLRHRLLLAELRPPVPRGHPQDRPLVPRRPQPRGRRADRRDRRSSRASSSSRPSPRASRTAASSSGCRASTATSARASTSPSRSPGEEILAMAASPGPRRSSAAIAAPRRRLDAERSGAGLSALAGHRRLVLCLRPRRRAGRRRRARRTARGRGWSRGSGRRASRPRSRRPWRVPK